MSPERWQLLEPLLDAALELTPEERPAFLATSCSSDPGLRAEVELLLQGHDRPDTLLEQPAARRFSSLLGVIAAPPPALVNGLYRIERRLGQGGTATVWLAHDLRHHRKVALKVVHPDLAVAFRAERFFAEVLRPALAATLGPDKRPVLVGFAAERDDRRELDRVSP